MDDARIRQVNVKMCDFKLIFAWLMSMSLLRLLRVSENAKHIISEESKPFIFNFRRDNKMFWIVHFTHCFLVFEEFINPLVRILVLIFYLFWHLSHTTAFTVHWNWKVSCSVDQLIYYRWSFPMCARFCLAKRENIISRESTRILLPSHFSLSSRSTSDTGMRGTIVKNVNIALADDSWWSKFVTRLSLRLRVSCARCVQSASLHADFPERMFSKITNKI